MYESVNARFANAGVDAVAGDAPLVLVQDYHFALAPRMIRDALHGSTIVTFWHIPWPDARAFEICPWGTHLLEGLLGSSVIGFQTARDCENFFDTVAATLPADVNRDQQVIAYKGRRTRVRAYPASIEWPNRWVAESPAIPDCRAGVRRELGLDPDALLGVGIDRLDYTKGIVEKFEAIERLLERAPELRGRFVFVQIAEPSREQLRAYRDLRARVHGARDRVNRRFGTPGYQPLILLETHHEPPAVFRLLRAADLCYVGSLHDGMNLVAKEFVCARDDERGVLVLSAFAGAAQQLTAALIVNPYAVDRTADVLAQALRMTPDEQAIRLRAMRAVVAECNSCWWAGRMVEDAASAREVRLGHRAHRPEPRRIPA
jgi:trehalose 6-phosphate synthase